MTKNVLEKSDGSQFTSIYEVPKSTGTSLIMINDAAFSTIPAGCYIINYGGFAETTTVAPNGLSMGDSACTNPPGETTYCSR
jgi:hypothetical protein